MDLNLDHIRALALRAKELVVETADAGEQQHKLLAFALFLVHKERLETDTASLAAKEGVKLDGSESHPLVLPALCSMAGTLATNDTRHASEIWPLVETVVLKGAERR